MSEATMLPLYLPPNETDPDVHLETSGRLPPGRIEIADDYDQPAPSTVEPNLIAYDPALGDTAPQWVAASSLFSAAASVPIGSLTSAVVSSYAGASDDLPAWRALTDVDGNELVLSLSGGAGRVIVSATVPVSADGAGLYLRGVEVRLVADGWTSAVQLPTLSSDSAAGTQVTLTFGPVELYLPPLRVHSVRPEFKATNGGSLAIYSSGAAISVTESPDNWSGSGSIRAEDMASVLVPVSTEDGRMINTGTATVLVAIDL